MTTKLNQDVWESVNTEHYMLSISTKVEFIVGLFYWTVLDCAGVL